MILLVLVLALIHAGADIDENTDSFQGELSLDSQHSVNTGPRDPFYRPLLGYMPDNPLNSYRISELELRGILWDNPKKVALFITPTGKRYFLEIGDTVGQEAGRITDIKQGRVVITLKDSTIIIKKVTRSNS